MKNHIIIILMLSSSFLYAQKKKVNDLAPNITISDWVYNVPLDKNLKGKYIVLEFWATWCGPCLKAVSHLNELQKNINRDDVYFVSITNENQDKIKKALKLLNFSSIVVSDITNQTQKAFFDNEQGAESIPLTILIDKNGLIKWIGSPNKLNGEILSKFVNNQLNVNKIVHDDQLNSDKYIKKLNENFGGLENNYLAMMINLVKDESIQYLLDIRDTNDEVDGFDSKYSKNYFGAKSIDIKNLMWYITGYNINQIVISDNLVNKKYQILFKSTTPNLNIEDQFLKALNLVKHETEISKEVNVLKYTDTNLLVKSSSVIVDKTYFESKILFSNHSINQLIQEINKISSEYFFIEKGLLGKYDFIIDFSNFDTILNSLKSYGFYVQVQNKTIQAYKYSNK